MISKFSNLIYTPLNLTDFRLLRSKNTYLYLESVNLTKLSQNNTAAWSLGHVIGHGLGQKGKNTSLNDTVALKQEKDYDAISVARNVASAQIADT